MKTKKILAIGIVALVACGVGLVVAQAPSKEYVVIKAPLSLEEGENVYHIPQSSIVYHSADGITTVYTLDGKPILKARDSDTTQIQLVSLYLQLTLLNHHRDQESPMSPLSFIQKIEG